MEGEECIVKLSDGDCGWVTAAAAPRPDNDCNNSINCEYDLLPLSIDTESNTITNEQANTTYDTLSFNFFS